MRRAREIVGKSIVSAESGEKLGSVADLLIGQGHRLVGLVVKHGWFGAEQVLPYSDVQTVGPDAVIAKGRSGLLNRRDWHQRATEATRSSALRGKRVVTVGGRTIGAVTDVLVDEHSGEINAYELARRTGPLARHSLLPRVGNVTVGPDVIVVSEETAADRGEQPQPERRHQPESTREGDAEHSQGSVVHDDGR